MKEGKGWLFVTEGDNEAKRALWARSVRKKANKVIVKELLKRFLPGWTLVDDTQIPEDRIVNLGDEVTVGIKNASLSKTTTVMIANGDIFYYEEGVGGCSW
ncbi:MAG: hypothetical protein HZA35_01680 [Parcubacteria group bacterium]|nr:hypothetical protein [Parcubacteria group bacterium]